MWAGLRVEISCFSTTSTDALNMVGPAGQPVIPYRTSENYKQNACVVHLRIDRFKLNLNFVIYA